MHHYYDYINCGMRELPRPPMPPLNCVYISERSKHYQNSTPPQNYYIVNRSYTTPTLCETFIERKKHNEPLTQGPAFPERRSGGSTI